MWPRSYEEKLTRLLRFYLNSRMLIRRYFSHHKVTIRNPFISKTIAIGYIESARDRSPRRAAQIKEKKEEKEETDHSHARAHETREEESILERGGRMRVEERKVTREGG